MSDPRHIPQVLASLKRARCSILCVGLWAGLAIEIQAQDKPTPSFVPGTGTRTDLKPYYFSIPAPRGQILDRKGRPLAQTKAVRRLQVSVPAAHRTSREKYVEWLEKAILELRAEVPEANLPDADKLSRHFQKRSELPLTVTDELADAVKMNLKTHPNVSVRTEYVRHYPQGEMASHLLGYVSAEGPPPSGAVQHGEPLWQRTRGATGLESAFNKQLTGTDGTLCVMIADSGRVDNEQVFTAPQAGRDVVTTLNLETQSLAEAALGATGRRGAVVIVDAFTGDIRAMVSKPGFDPNAFAKGISAADYAALTRDADGPLFDRAVQGSYPPGSVFKPFVVLAGLRAATVPAYSEFECGPTLMIDGREFDNWSKTDHGLFNARAALIRSCNTYFYQSAMVTGDVPILYMAREFGFGVAPWFHWKASAGSLPPRAPSNHDLANLSIGQGVTEASPLQVAMAMATLPNGKCRPRPRLVMQTQSQTGQTGDVVMPSRETLIPVSQEDLETVKHAMFGVVNHVNGTGKAVRLEKVAVFGKTGTAQWVLHGKKANVVWFAGFVDTMPPLAFSVALEGDAGEGSLSGGGTAAPVIAKVLRDIETRPSHHGVTFEEAVVLKEIDPLIGPHTDLTSLPPPPPAQERDNSIGGFFSRLFR